ncbi:MAG: CoA transferase, partial [Actinomycetota bacterium]|nr:CoA transferase [Actinomycetota bacterium]
MPGREGVTAAAAGPLTGVRVIELAGIGPGPFAAMLLADLGADVICIDRVATDRPTAAGAPERDVVRRGRRSIAVDLKHPAGRQVALDLLTK